MQRFEVFVDLGSAGPSGRLLARRSHIGPRTIVRKETIEQKTTPILEARLNGANEACGIYTLRKMRTLGATEMYIAGTVQWVCADCAFGIDAELASFAYDPYNPPARKHRFKGNIFDAYFGICPECGGCDGRTSIGRYHWVYCKRHGLKWCAGANWFDDWRDESEEDWRRNVLFLERFRECDPGNPEPNL